MKHSITFDRRVEEKINKYMKEKNTDNISRTANDLLLEILETKEKSTEAEKVLDYQELIKDNHELIEYIIEKSVKENFKYLEDFFAEYIVKTNKKFFEELHILSVVLRNVIIRGNGIEYYNSQVENSKKIAITKIKNNPFLQELLNEIGGQKNEG